VTYKAKAVTQIHLSLNISKVPAVISGTGKATDFKFGRYIHRVHPNRSPLKRLEKRERGYI